MSGIIIKNQEQIDGIRKSCQLASSCLSFIEPYVKPGITTNELDKRIDEFVRDNHAIPATLNYHGFPKSCCTSINEVICHGIPSEQELREGDIINIDVTTILDGYYGDKAITFAVGEISSRAGNLMRIAKLATEVGIGEVRPGAHFGDIGYAINKLVSLCGYSIVTQFCGHGTGVSFHEPPQILFREEKGTGAVMRPNMIFTVEPMINEASPRAVILADGWTAKTADGKLSAQYEHSILVLPNGVEVLTK